MPETRHLRTSLRNPHALTIQLPEEHDVKGEKKALELFEEKNLAVIY